MEKRGEEKRMEREGRGVEHGLGKACCKEQRLEFRAQLVSCLLKQNDVVTSHRIKILLIATQLVYPDNGG